MITKEVSHQNDGIIMIKTKSGKYEDRKIGTDEIYQSSWDIDGIGIEHDETDIPDTKGDEPEGTI